MKKTRSTMHDVAKLAGVSPITASRALITNPELVATKTRERIEAAAEELEYLPDLAASALASKRSRLVTALVSTFSASIFPPIIDALEEELAADGLQLLVGQTGYSTSNEAKLVRTVLGRKPDALVMTSALHSSATRKLIKRQEIPVFEIWDLPENPIDRAIGFRNQSVGKIAGEFLAQRHYGSAAFVSEHPDSEQGDLLTRRTKSRWIGFRDAYFELTGRYPCQFEILTGGEFVDGALAIEHIINSSERCDAVFFDSDTLAAGAIFKCQELGLRLPDDIAILGFGGFPISEAIYPTLSTVQVPLADIGRQAGSQLRKLLSGKTVRGKITEIPLAIRAGATA